jgi:hypothetical protein
LQQYKNVEMNRDAALNATENAASSEVFPTRSGQILAPSSDFPARSEKILAQARKLRLGARKLELGARKFRLRARKLELGTGNCGSEQENRSLEPENRMPECNFY